MRFQRITCVLIGSLAISGGVLRLGLMDRWCAAVQAAFLAGYLAGEFLSYVRWQDTKQVNTDA